MLQRFVVAMLHIIYAWHKHHERHSSLPEGWGVDEISNYGVFNASDHTIRWGPFFDANSRDFEYTLTPTNKTYGEFKIEGVVSVDGTMEQISGDESLSLEQFSTRIEKVLPEAEPLVDDWYLDPGLGIVYSTDATEWIFQKDLGYLYPDEEPDWFYSVDTDLGWLYIDDTHVTSESVGDTQAMVGYIYSAAIEGWIYLTAIDQGDGTITNLYYDAVSGWIILD